MTIVDRPRRMPIARAVMIAAALAFAGCSRAPEPVRSAAAPGSSDPALPSASASTRATGTLPRLEGLVVTTGWVQTHLPGLCLVDVRKPDDFERGHLPGALNIAWRAFSDPAARHPGNLEPSFEKLARLLERSGVASDVPVVIYSDPPNCWGEEGRLFWMLDLLGHEQVAIMDGGFPRWKREGRPVDRRAAGRSGARFVARPRPEKAISWQETRDRLGDPRVRFVDCRAYEEFIGNCPYGERRGGHIPGAANLVWSHLLDDQGCLKPRAKLEELLGERRIGRSQEIVAYCSGGIRSGFVYFVLRHLGFPKVRNYAGSMWEWADHAELPLVTGDK